jgi:ribosomal protein S18 acetylase RimI-like enzyme
MAARGVPAHVTVLHPFRAIVDAATALDVGEIAAGIESFDANFASTGRFPGAVLFLAPEPLERFAQMTRTLVDAFPDCPPYGGAFPDPHPHLTVGIGLDDATASSLERVIAPGLPFATRVDRLTMLVEDDDGQWTVGQSWPLAGSASPTLNPFEIRAAIPADADPIASYHDRCFKHTYASQLLAGEFGVPDLAGTRQQLHDWFLPNSGLDTRVAVDDGVPIGHVTVCGHQLVHLFVEPGHQHVGLGRHLLALGETMIAAGGHADLELHARVENVDAIAFYERAGWTVTDRVIHTVEHGISYDERVLVKRLFGMP